MSNSGNGGRSRAYQALRESEELHRATLSNISDAVFLTDDDGVFTFICPNVDVIFGYVPDEVQAMTRISRLLGENLFDRNELAARGELRNLECEITSKSGNPRTILIHLKAVSIKGGTVLYTCRDITERKQAEEELRRARVDLAHASRLALVGELMASVTHEISQPLMAILLNAVAGLRKLENETSLHDSANVRDILTDIRDQGQVAADIVERIRTLARKRPLEPQATDINDIARDTLRLVESDARRRGVRITAELAPSLPKAHADPVGLRQVLLNLILNGMDEMDRPEVKDRLLVVRSSPTPGAIEITVSDTGCGIPSDHAPKVFDAFFTTKKGGLGLGLAIARSIVEQHGGRIWVESDGARGATFYLTLPAIETAESAQA